jgi:hypothetical protein
MSTGTRNGRSSRRRRTISRAVFDPPLDHQKIEIRILARIAAGVRAEKHDARRSGGLHGCVPPHRLFRASPYKRMLPHSQSGTLAETSRMRRG